MLHKKKVSENSDTLSIGIANIGSIPGDIERNKQKIIAALDLFTEEKVNLAIFPEYSLTGYFWEPEKACRKFMEDFGCLDRLTGWLDDIAKNYVNQTLQYVVFNGLKKTGTGPGRFHNIDLILDKTRKHFAGRRTYQKTFLPGREKKHIVPGAGDTLVLETVWGKWGFLTCYDVCFPQLYHDLSSVHKVDGIIVCAAWRKQGKREYRALGIKEESYYQVQWNIMMQALACQNQAWVMAANAVGPHTRKGLDYCGNSGVWAPSGINLIKGSDTRGEYLILHNIDMIPEVRSERKEFCFADDAAYAHRCTTA